MGICWPELGRRWPVPSPCSRSWPTTAAQESTAFGYGWTNLLRQFITTDTSGQATVVKGSRKAWHYGTPDGSGDYFEPSGCNNSLHQNVGGDWVETQPNGFQLNYNAAGKLASMNDIQGNRWTLTYTGSLIESLRDPLGGRTTFAYASSKIQSITDPAGRVTGFVVDGNGDFAQITSPDTCAVDLTYSGHNLIGASSPLGQRITYTYDGSDADRLKEVQWPSGGRTTYTYRSDDDFVGTVVMDPFGQITTFGATGSDDDAIISSVTDPHGNFTELSQDSKARLNRVVDAARQCDHLRL